MEPASAIWLVGIVVVGLLGFIGWLIKDRFKKLEDVDSRLTKVETKLDVLGDINATLNKLKTDVEIIKIQVEHNAKP
jgi:hypothetical protein